MLGIAHLLLSVRAARPFSEFPPETSKVAPAGLQPQTGLGKAPRVPTPLKGIQGVDSLISEECCSKIAMAASEGYKNDQSR
jgi:hypothetical protein